MPPNKTLTMLLSHMMYSAAPDLVALGVARLFSTDRDDLILDIGKGLCTSSSDSLTYSPIQSMPKKHHRQQYTKPSSSVHPSLEPSRPPTDQKDGTSSPSVNDLINDLRSTQISKNAAERITETPLTTNPRTVHPLLKEFLQIPDTPPPRPRPGMRPAAGTRMRRIPGPPPPRSWLMSSRHAPKNQENAGDGERKIVHRLARLPGVEMPRKDSLLHYALRSLAENWKWHVSYDEYYLADLPTKLKEQLLSFVATYSDEGSYEGLRVLFLDETEVEGASGNSDVKRLDLGNQIGRGIGLRQLKTYLTGDTDHSKVSAAGSVWEPSSSTASKDNQRPSNSPPSPSWEDEVDAEGFPRPLLAKSLQLPRFPALAHLSLAHPDPKSASWATLLALASHLSTLTHLSLAYWPFPTLTPNSFTTHILPKVSQGAHQPANTGIEYGGTNYYSRGEDELSEAAGLLKRLANATYCLKWLDLEGCAEWWAALRYEEMDTEDADISDFVSPSRPRTLGPDFNGSWRSLEWMGMGAGWLPKEYEQNGCSTLCHQKGNCAPSSHFSNKADTPVDAISNPSRPYAGWLGTRDGADDMAERLRKHRRQKEVEDFLALERVARGTVDWIRGKRRDASGKWVRFDLRRPDGMGSAYAKVGDMSIEGQV